MHPFILIGYIPLTITLTLIINDDLRTATKLQCQNEAIRPIQWCDA
jgi:hypothetical protein